MFRSISGVIEPQPIRPKPPALLTAEAKLPSAAPDHATLNDWIFNIKKFGDFVHVLIIKKAPAGNSRRLILD